MRSSLLLAALFAVLPACDLPPPALPLDLTAVALAAPGVTCGLGTHLDPERGCTADATGSGAVLRLTEEMRTTSLFVPRRVLYVLDRRVGLYQWRAPAPAPDGGAAAEPPAERAHTPIYDAPVPAGQHVLSVLFAYQGHGEGRFAYLAGYKFEVRSSHAVTLAAGEATAITVTAYEKGGVTTPLEERPAVSWTGAPPR